MKSNQWKTYRTRFLVKAKQLNSSLSFTDLLGRQHCGRKGDYLVESCDGVLTITPRQIFEDIYVPMSGEMSGEVSGDPVADSVPANGTNGSNGAARNGTARFDPAKVDPAMLDPAKIKPEKIDAAKIDSAKFEPLPIVRIRPQKSRASVSLFSTSPDPSRVRRKYPQPVRPTPSRVGAM